MKNTSINSERINIPVCWLLTESIAKNTLLWKLHLKRLQSALASVYTVYSVYEEVHFTAMYKASIKSNSCDFAKYSRSNSLAMNCQWYNGYMCSCVETLQRQQNYCGLVVVWPSQGLFLIALLCLNFGVQTKEREKITPIPQP